MKNIKYCNLQFRVNVLGQAILPREKTIMLTGAMINQFKYLYCIGEEGCFKCKNRNMCIIQKMMGQGFEIIEPMVMQNEVYPKFLLQCQDRRSRFEEGDRLEFTIVLFDDLVQLFSQYIYVFSILGEIGIGPNRVKYDLISVVDIHKNYVYKDGYLSGSLSLLDLQDYVASRMDSVNFNKMRFISSCCLQTNYKTDYVIDNYSLYFCLKNRLESVGILQEEDSERLGMLLYSEPVVCKLYIRWSKRYYHIKSREKNIIIPQSNGYVLFNEDITPYIKYILVCEKLCMGQNIVLGFGQYVMERGNVYE